MGERRSAYRVLVRKHEERRHLEDLGVDGRRENNIKMDLLDVGWWGIDWIDLAQDWDRWRGIVNAMTNLRVP
jgi:hypothetical protein